MAHNDRYLFKLPLDEISGDKIYITRADPVMETEPVSSMTSKCHGSPKVIPDDVFGSCISLDGIKDSIELISVPNIFNQPLTLSLWIKPNTPDSKETSTILSFAKDENNLILVNITQESSIEISYKSDDISVTITNKIDSYDKWFHIAGIFDPVEKVLKMYINGSEVVGEQGVFTSSMEVNNKYILGYNGNDTGYYKGAIADLRVFPKLLTTDELKNIITSGQSAAATFKTTYPVDLHINDDNVNNIFYISDGEFINNCFFVIENCSSQKFVLKGKTGETASKDNFHFKLMFKPSTFEQSSNSTVMLKNIPGWSVTDLEMDKTGVLSFSLLYIEASSLVFAPGESVKFELEYTSADIQGGARGTTVQLLYKDIYYLNDNNSIEGNRIKAVDIVNQRGKKNIPLYVGIVGSNTILNDARAGTSAIGSRSSLLIRIMNTLKKDITNPGRNNLSLSKSTGEARSKFTLSFDDPAGEEWDLASKNQLNAITLQYRNPGNEYWQEIKDRNAGQGESPIFEIIPEIESLAPVTSIEIKLDNIYSNAPSGFSNIYINYEDIPGYWDGQFVVQVEKTPIVHKNMRRSKNVGIGIMPDDKNRLKISGNFNVSDGNFVLSSGSLAINTKIEPDEDTDTKMIVNGNINSFRKIKEKGYDLIPRGTIVMWHGSSIPGGWRLCDGTEGTPDLRARFVVGVGYNRHTGDCFTLGTTGGKSSIRLDTRHLPSHSHTIPDPGHSHSINDPGHDHKLFKLQESSTDEDDSSLKIYRRERAGDRYTQKSTTGITIRSKKTGITATNNTGSNNSFDMKPPYFALYYIMKD